MEKLNIAEILKDCPSGMELDCTVFEDVYFDCIDQEKSFIKCYIQNDSHKISVSFTKYGCYANIEKSKCVIFPKGKTTWEGFQRPFKDGDIVVAQDGKFIQMFILKLQQGDNRGYCHIGYNFNLNTFFEEGYWNFHRLATEEEKEKLFKVLKENGYKWNLETKTLEKLTVHKFKVGDKIRHKTHTKQENTVTEVKDTHYILDDELALPFTSQDEYELVPNKFDITTLKPFDKVLVRDNNTQKWTADLFSFFDKSMIYPYSCVGHYTNQCIPYNDETKHLLGTTNDCDDFYKTWEF